MNTQHALYYSTFCYFCQKVLMFLRKKGEHSIELRSTSDRTYAVELMQGGGKGQVPCLKIERDGNVEWMYESDDIVAYLDQALI